MAQIDVAACIAGLLMEEGRVEVPGLGAFIGTRQPARIDPFLQMASPPGLGLTFHPDIQTEGAGLYGYVAKRHALSLKHAEDVVREYVHAVQIRLGGKEVVILPQIGCLRQSIEGYLQFEQESANLNIDAFALPQVSAMRTERPVWAPIDTPAQEEEERVSVSDYIPAPSRPRPALSLVIMLGALVVGVGAYALFRPHFEEFFTPAYKKGDHTLLRGARSGEHTVDSPATTAHEPGDSALAARQKLLLPDAHPDTCVIAIGLFRDPRNVARLVKKIEDAGLEPYSKTESGQTRVGVRFPYTEDAEIAGHLALVQSKLEPSAFVLLK